MTGGGTDEWDWRNLDDLLNYETPKVVVIRDRRLGFLYYLICSTIFMYVVGFQILYSNEHMVKTVVTGTSRLELIQPTKSNCSPDTPGCESDFPSLETLPYCKEFVGESDIESSYRKPCVFSDAHSIAPDGMLDDHLLIPTSVASEVQSKGCEPSASNGHNCDEEYVGSGHRNSVFVAGVENYLLHISHTYTLLEHGTSTEVQGHYLECDKSQDKVTVDVHANVYGTGEMQCEGKVLRKPIECLNGDCAFSPKEEEDESEKGGADALKGLETGGNIKAFLLDPSSWLRHSRRLGASLLSRASRVISPEEEKEEKQEEKNEFVRNKKEAELRHNHHHAHLHRHSQHRTAHHHPIVRRNVVIDADGHLSPGAGSDTVDDTAKDSVIAEHPVMTRAAAAVGFAKEDKKAPASQEATKRDGIWSLPQADVITVDKILSLADLSFDNTWNNNEKSLREAGTVITIEAIYSNLHPWSTSFGNVEVEYEYRVSRRPVEDFGTQVYSQHNPNFPQQRTLEDRHGVYIVVKIAGQFGQFSFTYLLILLATSAGLMRIANIAVDKIALWFMPMKETYKYSKFEFTERVYDMQRDLDALARAAADDEARDDAPAEEEPSAATAHTQQEADF